MLRSVKQPRLEPIAWILDPHRHHRPQRCHHAHDAHECALLHRPARGDVAARLDARGAGLFDFHRQTKSRARRHPHAERGGGRGGSAPVSAAPAAATPKPRVGWELTAHILLSMGAAALLFAAAVTAILLVILDRRLRMRRIADLSSALPPLDALEKIMFRLVAAGFGLLTLALITGFVFVTNLFTQNLVQKDGAVADRLAHLRRAAHRAVALRLARTLGRALDLERLRHFGGRVFRREIRPRRFVRAALGLIFGEWNTRP